MNSNLLYKIHCTQPHSRYVDITVEYLLDNHCNYANFEIAAWRPGRYELQHYAKNIHKIGVENEQNEILVLKKVDRNTWQITTGNSRLIKITYQYYAHQMDAGGCWLDEEQLYLNFIGCLLFPQGRLDLACSVKLELPPHYKIVCALSPNENFELIANSVSELFDCPMIASENLQKWEYQVERASFYCWFVGHHQLNIQQLLSDFKNFTTAQVALFGDFPFESYHFLIQCLPFRHYHGVEHRNSTVIVLGPSNELHVAPLYDELLGISSHELFHAWNVCKIRPTEMMPYQFSKAAYFETGFVAEGFTTYYGDLMLVRAGVFSAQRYLQEWNKTLKQHFQNFGNYNLSLADSSTDLWVDGYIQGIPHRKVSIYGKGAVVAWLLDLTIRKETNHAHNLDKVMQLLWHRFGKIDKGYSVEDIFTLITEVSGSKAFDFLKEAVFGTTNLQHYLIDLAAFFHLICTQCWPSATSARKFGMQISLHSQGWLVDKVEPQSPADRVIGKGDLILNVLGNTLEEFESYLEHSEQIALEVIRDYNRIQVKLTQDDRKYGGWIEIGYSEDYEGTYYWE